MRAEYDPRARPNHGAGLGSENPRTLKEKIKDSLSDYPLQSRILLILVGFTLGATAITTLAFFAFPATLAIFSATLGISGAAALIVPLTLLGLIGGLTFISALLGLLEITKTSPEENKRFNRILQILSLIFVPAILSIFLTAAFPAFLAAISIQSSTGAILGGIATPIAMAAMVCLIPGVLVLSRYADMLWGESDSITRRKLSDKPLTLEDDLTGGFAPNQANPSNISSNKSIATKEVKTSKKVKSIPQMPIEAELDQSLILARELALKETKSNNQIEEKKEASMQNYSFSQEQLYLFLGDKDYQNYLTTQIAKNPDKKLTDPKDIAIKMHSINLSVDLRSRIIKEIRPRGQQDNISKKRIRDLMNNLLYCFYSAREGEEQSYPITGVRLREGIRSSEYLQKDLLFCLYVLASYAHNEEEREHLMRIADHVLKDKEPQLSDEAWRKNIQKFVQENLEEMDNNLSKNLIKESAVIIKNYFNKQTIEENEVFGVLGALGGINQSTIKNTTLRVILGNIRPISIMVQKGLMPKSQSKPSPEETFQYLMQLSNSLHEIPKNEEASLLTVKKDYQSILAHAARAHYQDPSLLLNELIQNIEAGKIQEAKQQITHILEDFIENNDTKFKTQYISEQPRIILAMSEEMAKQNKLLEKSFIIELIQKLQGTHQLMEEKNPKKEILNLIIKSMEAIQSLENKPMDEKDEKHKDDLDKVLIQLLENFREITICDDKIPFADRKLFGYYAENLVLVFLKALNPALFSKMSVEALSSPISIRSLQFAIYPSLMLKKDLEKLNNINASQMTEFIQNVKRTLFYPETGNSQFSQELKDSIDFRRELLNLLPPDTTPVESKSAKLNSTIQEKLMDLLEASQSKINKEDFLFLLYIKIAYSENQKEKAILNGIIKKIDMDSISAKEIQTAIKGLSQETEVKQIQVAESLISQGIFSGNNSGKPADEPLNDTKAEDDFKPNCNEL